MNARIVVTSAAREGARKATVDGGGSDAAYARMREILLSAGINLDRVQMSIKPHEAAYGSTLVIEIDYQYRTSTPLMLAICGSEIPLRAEIVCRSERVR